MPAVKSNRPINLPLSQVIAVNSKSPIAMASILHRVSGIVLFLLVPVMLCILQTSLTSQEGFDAVFENVALRFVAWIFVAATAYHFVMGIKHLLADLGMNEEFNSGRTAAVISFVIAAVLIVASFVWVMF
ncbi:succinate dehydrogenase, cytochrome b556 subunit [Moraxella pluranimalium]|uniref:Succinate dehydrogenase cytochrome b556 subunit n=1 Tax=Moraxella pluranimalium TaxID=470453 RepID=A0A1T0CRB0_9GAMM|nr:succinate dehydrogenase, cytochrome b556 subunit [Moraxella pluranimalium]OOS24883.1 succinate dehydrogenase, cytochrome b556 subunit [Moraxella pluranimalium]